MGRTKRTTTADPEEFGHRSGNPSDSGEQLLDALVHLNIARSNVLAYPAGHVMVTRSLEDLLPRLHELARVSGSFSFGATRDSLLYGSGTIGAKSSACRHLAEALYQRNIAAVSFSPVWARRSWPGLSLC